MINRFLALLGFALSVAFGAAADEWSWYSRLQVEQVSVALLLADYPLPQGQLRTVIGSGKLPHLGGSNYGGEGPNGTIALTNPNSKTGYYAVRVHYRLSDPLPAAKDIPIEGAELIYVSAEGWTFVQEPSRTIKRMLPELKKMMREKGASPIGFAESFVLGDSAQTPNKAPEPTP